MTYISKLTDNSNTQLSSSTRQSFVITLLAITLGLLSVAPTAAADASPDHVFLLIGQSNMVGRAKLEPQDKVEIDGCLLWNGKGWEKAKPGFNRYSTHQKPNSTQGMNCGPSFVKAYQKANPGITVGIVCWARGGTSLEEWHPDKKPQDLYRQAVKQTHAALKIGGQLKGILWHQGEANSQRSQKYPKLLRDHVGRLRAEFKQPELPFVFSQLGQWKSNYTEFNKMIILQPARISNTGCVRTNDLTNFDPYHFDRKSQLELGKRYAAVMLKLIK